MCVSCMRACVCAWGHNGGCACVLVGGGRGAWGAWCGLRACMCVCLCLFSPVPVHVRARARECGLCRAVGVYVSDQPSAPPPEQHRVRAPLRLVHRRPFRRRRAPCFAPAFALVFAEHHGACDRERKTLVFAAASLRKVAAAPPDTNIMGKHGAVPAESWRGPTALPQCSG